MPQQSLIEIKGPVFRRLAEMICGDPPYTEVFPYRSGTQLTSFFDDLWLDHVHDGSTRRFWVERVLKEIAEPPDYSTAGAQLILTDNLRKVIEHIVEPTVFPPSALNPDSHLRAIQQLNEVLYQNNLCIMYDGARKRSDLLSLGDQGVPTGAGEPVAVEPGVLVVRPTVFQIPRIRTLEKPQCGILMPFGGLFDEIYDHNIRPAVVDSGYNPLRADELWKHQIIMNDIFDMIYHSAAVVADLTGRNPNVFYELGLAHVLGKTVVPIVQDENDIPFDLRHHRYLKYSPTTEGRKSLGPQLEARLRELLSQREGAP